MDARWTDTNDIRANLPAIADSSSRPVSRTALTVFVRGTTELEPAIDAFTLMPHIESSEEKQINEATGGVELSAVTSRLENRDIQGEEYPTTQARPGEGPESRYMKPQAGDRSRFRPWGYI